MEGCVITLAEPVRQVNILSAIVQAVASEFGCPVYSDEVLEKFKKPCFFVSASSTMTHQTVNWCRKEFVLQLTYFPKDTNKNEITYLDVIDRVQILFQVGIQVNDRYLHFESIEDDRVGEEQDILQITITIPYTESIAHAVPSDVELMDEVDMEIRTQYDLGKTKAEEEIWNSVITNEEE